MRPSHSLILFFLAFTFLALPRGQAQRRLNVRLCAIAVGATVDKPRLDEKTPHVDIVDIGYLESRLQNIHLELMAAIHDQPSLEKRYEALQQELKKRKADWPVARATQASWSSVKVNGHKYSQAEVEAGEDQFWMNQAKTAVVELDQFAQKLQFLIDQDLELSAQWSQVVGTGQADNSALLNSVAISLEQSVDINKETANASLLKTAAVEAIGLSSSRESLVTLGRLQNRQTLQNVERSVLVRDVLIPQILGVKNSFELLLLF